MIADAQTRTVFEGAARVEELSVSRPAHVTPEIAGRTEPIILRGFVSDWPVVSAARRSEQALFDYLMAFDQGLPVPVSVGPPSLKGRIFYDEDYTGINARRGNSYFKSFLERVLHHGRESEPPVIYMASMGLDECVPGFDNDNSVDFGAETPLASIWIGTRTRIAAHNDLPLNIACVAAGRRTFTLFPPDQTANLYPGPFELTPAGRPISMVDFHAPDFEMYPKFREAINHACVAELEPGDALFIPSMWWHHVEATSAFNVLVNYWWRSVPSYLGTPQDVLNHAMMTLRDLPENEREIWRDVFDYYVFSASEHDKDHIPEHIRGVLNPIDERMAKRLRNFLRGRLDR